MFDHKLRPLINPHVIRAAAFFHQCNATANQLTGAALVAAGFAVLSISNGYFLMGLIFILINRILDGIDGPLSRLTHPPTQNHQSGGTDFGGYLDIVADFLFYASIPLAFALYDHIENALPAAFLLFSFIGSCITFMAFAAIAAKRHLTTEAQGKKSFFYLAGLMEGSETMAFFVLMCLFAPFFDVLAYTFGALCLISTAGRMATAHKLLK